MITGLKNFNYSICIAGNDTEINYYTYQENVTLFKKKIITKYFLIDKVNQFKLDNPPTFYISDRQDIIYYEDRLLYGFENRPYDRSDGFEDRLFEPDNYYEEKIKYIPRREIHMSITLPLKVPLGILPYNFHDYDNSGNICIGFIFEIDLDDRIEIKKCKTKKCLIKVPECCFYFTKEYIKDFKNIKNERYNSRIDCMIKGLQKYNYFYNIYGNEIQYDRDYF